MTTSRQWRCKLCGKIRNSPEACVMHEFFHEERDDYPDDDMAQWIAAGKPRWWRFEPVTESNPKKSSEGTTFSFLKRVWLTPNFFRFRIIDTPWFGVYVHKFVGPDPLAHSHPYSFITIGLTGGYLEEITGHAERTHKRFRPYYFSRKRFHRVAEIHGDSAWTLIFRSRRNEDWYFLIDGSPVLHSEHKPPEAYSNKRPDSFYRSERTGATGG